MNPIVNTLVTLSFALLGSPAWARGVVCPKWVCGANSPVVDGARASSVDTSGLVLVSIRTPPTAPREMRGPVAQPLPFVPGWGVNLNSPLVSGAATADAALHGAAIGAAPSRSVIRR